MASLRDEARAYIDEARDGIIWLALWKTGRSWHLQAMYSTEYVEACRILNRPTHWEIDNDDLDELQRIYQEDSNAKLLNGYYTNIGSLEEMTVDSLVDGLRWQYSMGGNVEGILQEMGRA